MTSRDRTATQGAANTVLLRGRVTTAPQDRELPSGTVIVTLRVSVPRGPSPMSAGSKQTADWIDCVAWGAKVRRSAQRWHVGDQVELEGALRRRFYRGDGGAGSRLEVEVLTGRVLSRAEGRQAG